MLFSISFTVQASWSEAADKSSGMDVSRYKLCTRKWPYCTVYVPRTGKQFSNQITIDSGTKRDVEEFFIYFFACSDFIVLSIYDVLVERERKRERERERD